MFKKIHYCALEKLILLYMEVKQRQRSFQIEICLQVKFAYINLRMLAASNYFLIVLYQFLAKYPVILSAL